jgi:hypothetical protein
VIKRADADTVARQAVALHLGDLRARGTSLIAEARQPAGEAPGQEGRPSASG